MLPELTVLRWFTAWSFDAPVTVLVVTLAAGYLALARRVPWPRSRTAWFLFAGLGSLVIVTMSFMGTYQEVLLWPLAVQDVLLMTLVPVGLTLGRPLALLRAVRPRPEREPGRVVRFLSFPMIGSIAAVSVLIVIYTTGWDEARLNSPALLQLTRLLLVVVGCSFLWPLLGVDAGTGRTSYPIRAMVGFIDGLLDAIPGLAVLGTTHSIAAAHYASVGRSYARDQQIGGTAMVALSELVGLPALLVLLVQWVRTDAVHAHAVDVVMAAEDVAAGRDDELLLQPWWETNAGPLEGRFKRG